MIVWVDFGPTQGSEQRGTQPALVVSTADYLTSVRGLIVVVPLTSVDRDWPHHVAVTGTRTGLPKQSFAMTEQPRTISMRRLVRKTGTASEATVSEVDRWLRDFIGL
jgi:mRNA interferase MazF